jgi:hypothetical protein
MTFLAVPGQPGCDVVGVLCSGEIILVTEIALQRFASEVSGGTALVATLARNAEV